MDNQIAPELICHGGPITALTAYSQKVVWGCGSEMCVFNLRTNKLVAKQQILVGAIVHGICAGPVHDQHHHLLCVYGAKQARIVSIDVLNDSNDIMLLSDVMNFMDWIWDVCWLGDQHKDGNIAFALAHNSVIKWNWQSRKIITKRNCAENCILYCAHLIGHRWKNLVLAAGTVFNQIVLWPVACDSQHNDEPVDVIQTFSGHQGVIFAIKYHSDLQRLCSVSDDRSIRMWQLTFPNGKQSEPSPIDWRSVKSDLFLVLYGHSARVWDVVLTPTYFASVGEDAGCCIWNYAGSILHKFKGHKGRSIWKVATSKDEKFVLTGGGDGSIRLWEVYQEKTQKTSQKIVSIPQNNASIPEDFPRIVKMLNFDLVLIMMNSGHLYSYCVTDQRFSLRLSNSRFRSYSIVCPCPDQVTVALGNMMGVVQLMHMSDVQDEDTKLTEMSLFSGKVLSLVWLDRHRFLASGPGGLCLLLKLNTTEEAEPNDVNLCLKIQHHLTLPPSKHRWITAACFVPASGENAAAQSALVCGDKDGSIHCYSFEDESTFVKNGVEPTKSFTRVHGKSGVTFVSYKDGILYTAGRDGFYRQWGVKAQNLSQLHGNKIIKGFEWIDRLEWYNNDLLVYGFFSSTFVVWSVTLNQQLMSVQCGGGHRAWGCCHDNDMLRFVYLKGGKIYMVDSGYQTKQTILQPAMHGRKLCDVKFLAILSDENDEPIHIVCSAGEDTTVNIGAFINSSSLSSWKPIITLKGHMSSVRALTISSHSINNSCTSKGIAHFTQQPFQDRMHKNNNFILFSGGGRAEIRAWSLTILQDNVCSKAHPNVIIQDNLCPEAQENISHFNINSLSEAARNVDLHQPCDELSSDDITEESSILDLNVLNTKSDHAISNSVPTGSKEYPPDQIQCNYQHLSTHFLRQPHYQQIGFKSHKQKLDPETRILSLDASCVADLWDECRNRNSSSSHKLLDTDLDHLSRVHILSCAGSDGVFRVFAFDELSKTFSCLANSSFHQGCVLKVLHYVHYSNSTLCSFAVSTSTNGKVVFWPVDPLVEKLVSHLVSKKQTKSYLNCNRGWQPESCSSVKFGSCTNAVDNEDDEEISDDEPETSVKEEKDLEPLVYLQAHQSGVNSLHLLQISESEVLLASGGDDNAVTVQLLEVLDSGIKVLAKVTKEDAHAAQVTGIHLISSTLIVSASIDQRICLWSIQGPHKSHLQFQLQMVACRYISVADVSSMSVHLYKNSVYLSVGGEGLCLFRLNTTDTSE